MYMDAPYLINVLYCLQLINGHQMQVFSSAQNISSDLIISLAFDTCFGHAYTAALMECECAMHNYVH